MSGGGSLFQSRRRFVAGASSLLGGLAMPALRTAAFAQPIDARLPPLRSDDPLPGPDFKALRKKDPQRILGKAEALFAGDIAKCNALNIASNCSI